MGKAYRTRTIKSGNSVALRLPAELGVEPGRDWRVREENGRFVFEPMPADPQRIDLTGIAGSMPWLKPLPREDFDDSSRDWDLLGQPQGR
jgi:antitoxin VapB